MQSWKLDEYNGVETWFHKDAEGKKTLEHRESVTQHTDFNKAMWNEGRRKHRDGFHFVAHIPDIVIIKWLGDGVNVFDKNDRKKVKQLLNSSDWRYLRTDPGSL